MEARQPGVVRERVRERARERGQVRAGKRCRGEASGSGTRESPAAAKKGQ